MHLAMRLTDNIEIGAVRVHGQDGLEVIETDNLNEVRNQRTEDEPRTWQVSLPTCDIDNDRTDYDALLTIWKASFRGLYSFDFWCFVDDELVSVRFAAPLQISAPAGHLRHVDTFTLRETPGE